MSLSRLFLIVLMLCPALAGAVTLRLCTDANPRPPNLMPDGSGIADQRVAAAAREAGFIPQFFPVSLTRCAAEVKAGLLHAFPLVPYKPEAFPFVAFPMHDGVADVRRATLTVRQVLFRRLDSSAYWDGSRFVGVKRPVLIAAGSSVIVEKLKAMKVPFDANGKSLENNFAKLLAGRGDAVIGVDVEGAALMERPDFKGKLEMLSIPLIDEPYFAVVSKPFYEANRDAVEKMWDAVGRLNQPAKALKK